ncbi:MAG: hypothetical protein AB1717_07425 [Pseudomonadota bacterium]
MTEIKRPYPSWFPRRNVETGKTAQRGQVGVKNSRASGKAMLRFRSIEVEQHLPHQDL